MPSRIPTSTPRKIALRKRKIFLAIGILFVVGLLFAIDIAKKDGGTTQARNYRPTFVCEDAWGHEHELNYENFEGDHFDVTPREGCWGGQVVLPNAWNSRWHFNVLGNNPETWIAFGWPDSLPPTGPYGRTAVIEFPYHPTKFRLQGKGTFRFYRR